MKQRRLALFTNSLVLFALVLSPCASPAFAETNVTFTVTSNSDVVDFLPGDGVCETATGNGMCTLRAAIMEANVHIGADSIVLPAAMYKLAISGADEDLSATGDLDITESLTISGAGAGETIIDAEGLNDRVLEILSPTQGVTMTGLTIQYGATFDGGGGILNNVAHLILEDVLVFHNLAGFGGGIVSYAELDLKNVVIDQNSAFVQGGGIFIRSVNLSAEDSDFTNNSTDIEGGAIYAGVDSHIQMVRSNFSSNTAIEDGGTIYLSFSWLEMDNGTISEGDAGNAGGGIYAAEGSKATLSNTTLTSNHAASAGGVMIAAGADFSGSYLLFDSNSADNLGGAISNQDAELSLFDSTLRKNSANFGGAINTFFGTSNIAASTLISNTATTNGGGIYLTGSMTIKQSTLNANHAKDGGGILNGLGDLWIENSTLSRNRADDNGGGIFNGADTYIFNSTITGNVAGSDLLHPGGEGGGIFNPAMHTYFRNTILAGNHHRYLTTFVDDDCNGALTSGDYNLVGTLADCTLDGVLDHNLIGEDPMLGELADNGGKTYTHALLEGSPAIDAGNTMWCLGIEDVILVLDQRSFDRPRDGDDDGAAFCDIGAFELSHTVSMYLPFLVK